MRVVVRNNSAAVQMGGTVASRTSSRGLGSNYLAPSAGVLSAAATASSSGASGSTPQPQFGGTTFGAFKTDYGGTAPGKGADTGAKLEFLHTQLNCVGNEKVVLERFRLLGPSHRRQGGALRAVTCGSPCACDGSSISVLLSAHMNSETWNANVSPCWSANSVP